MSQLGFTFYPKDWWASDSFYILNPFERYLYLELLFLMYANGGFVANNRVMIEARLRIAIREDVWSKITDLLVKEGDMLTHESVNKRMKKAISSRENGKKGGRPPQEPKKPTEETQNNPPSEIERERESKTERESETEPPPPDDNKPDLSGSNLFRKPNIPTKLEVWALFKGQGATAEMAKSFWEKHEGTGWYINNSPIKNWSAVANRFITNWNSSDFKDQQQSSAPPLKRG